LSINAVQLHAILPGGPYSLAIPAGSTANVHGLFDDLPVGVYTSLRTFNHNQFLNLADHLDRLEGSMTLLGWEYHLDRLRLRRALHQVCSAYPGADARVRIDILAREVPSPGGPFRELIGLFPFKPVPTQLYEAGARVAIARHLTRANPRAKQAHFALERRPFLAEHPGAYECLLVDPDGYILEGTTSNFYAVKKGELWTAGEGVLEGIARKIVLQVARECAVPVRLEAVQVDEIARLDECALSSSSRAIVPIVEIDGRTVADGRPGPVTRRLLAAYNDYVARALAPAVAS
jgi:branched-chain amino acid aminotransferase